MNSNIQKIATNFCVKNLKECFKRNIEDQKPTMNEEWQRLIENTVHEAYAESWQVYRYDSKLDELVFVNPDSGLMEYECCMSEKKLSNDFNEYTCSPLKEVG